MIANIFGIIIVVFAIALISVPILGFIFRRRIGHDILGWHKVDEITEVHGINLHGKCIYCGKDCIQDSQGNWF